MDIFTIVIIGIVVFVIITLCAYCCKKSKQGSVLAPPVTVATTHITATPIVHPPYPTDARHPVPQPVVQPMPQPMQPSGIGFGDYTGGYQTAPYPPTPGQHIAPYPPAQAAAPPPSYNEAMSQPVMPPPPVPEHYTKQAPYNPNY